MGGRREEGTGGVWGEERGGGRWDVGGGERRGRWDVGGGERRGQVECDGRKEEGCVVNCLSLCACRFGVSASLKTLPHRGKIVTATKDCTVGNIHVVVCVRVVWCGVVWCGVVWCGVVWCGVVWCGVHVACREVCTCSEVYM